MPPTVASSPGKWPSVPGWLVRAHTLKRRHASDFLTEKPEVLQAQGEGWIMLGVDWIFAEVSEG